MSTVTAAPNLTAASTGRLPEAVQVPALYRARITHTRRSPFRHAFHYASFYWLTDIDQPPDLPLGLRWLARFDPADHDDPRPALTAAGITADRVLRLAHARSLGHGFNPLGVYWCYQHGQPVAVVAEVHNTYGERISYLLHPDDHGRATTPKQMYVSPFYPVDGHYDLRISTPADQLTITITYRRGTDAPFTATLTAHRRAATTGQLLRCWLRHPATPWRTSALIRWQGLRLWARRLTVHPR